MIRERIREPAAGLKSPGAESPQSAIAKSSSDLPLLRQKSQLQMASRSKLELYNRYFEKMLKREDITNEAGYITVIEEATEGVERVEQIDMNLRAKFLINLLSVHVRYAPLTRLECYPKLMEVASRLFSIHKLIPDFKLKVSSLVSIANAFFLDQDYKLAYRFAQTAIEAVLVENPDPDALAPLLSKAYNLKGLSLMIPNVPAAGESGEPLAKKLSVLGRAKTAFEKGKAITEAPATFDPQAALNFEQTLLKLAAVMQKASSKLKQEGKTKTIRSGESAASNKDFSLTQLSIEKVINDRVMRHRETNSITGSRPARIGKASPDPRSRSKSKAAGRSRQSSHKDFFHPANPVARGRDYELSGRNEVRRATAHKTDAMSEELHREDNLSERKSSEHKRPKSTNSNLENHCEDLADGQDEGNKDNLSSKDNFPDTPMSIIPSTRWKEGTGKQPKRQRRVPAAGSGAQPTRQMVEKAVETDLVPISGQSEDPVYGYMLERYLDLVKQKEELTKQDQQSLLKDKLNQQMEAILQILLQQQAMQKQSIVSLHKNPNPTSVQIQPAQPPTAGTSPKSHQQKPIVVVSKGSLVSPATTPAPANKNEIQPGRLKKDFYTKPSENPEDSAKTAIAIPQRNEEEEDLRRYAENDEPSEEVQPTRQLDMTNLREQQADRYDQVYEPKVVHETTLRNYRIKNHSRLKPMERTYFLKDYELDLRRMLKDFKEQIASKQIDFKKQIVINSVVYVIKVTISYESHNFSVTIYPNIDKNLSDPNEFDNISQYLFKREILNEVQFIEMLQEIVVIDKIPPIDSIYTIGTFYELIERILMPTLILDFEETQGMIQLEAWPFSVEMLFDTEIMFVNKQASHWLYHLYDNAFRLFTHLTEEINEEGNRDNEMQEDMREQSSAFENVPLEIVIDPDDFSLFFECLGQFSQHVQEDFKRIESFPDNENKSEHMKELTKKIFQLLSAKQKYMISENYPFPAEAFTAIDENEQPLTCKSVIQCLLLHLLSNLESIYAEVSIQIFKDAYFQTARFCRVWEYLTKVLLFIVQDDYEEREVTIYSRFVFISNDYQAEVSKSKVYQHSVPYSWLDETYKITMENLEWEDKLIVFKFLTDGFTIKKPKTLETSDEAEREARESEKLTYMLRSSNTSVVAHKTVFVSFEYRYPILLRVLAQIGVPIGLSVMFFDIEQCIEIPVMFLIIHPRKLWLADIWRREGTLENYDPSKSSDKDQVLSKFFILQYLSLGGWQQVIDNILPYIQDFVSAGEKETSFFFDSLECFI